MRIEKEKTKELSTILTGKLKTDFEVWYCKNVHYTPLQDLNSTLWMQSKNILHTHIVDFLDSKLEHIDTMTTYIASVCIVNGRELGVYRTRFKAIEQGIIYINSIIE
jgi:hypothetical protein